MPEHAASAPPLRRLAGTAWFDTARGGAAHALADVRRFTRRTWRLPSNVPASSAHHALSARLPARSALARLVRTLAGRFVVVNYAPAAALSRPEAALVRGLARAAVVGLPVAPWHVARPGAHARWPADSRRAYEEALAASWLATRPGVRQAAMQARRVAVGLYETAPRVTATAAVTGPIGALGGPVVADRAGFAIVAAYHLVLLVDTAESPATPSWAAVDAAVAAAVALGADAGTAPQAARAWFAGRVLLPDALAIEAMDPTSRQLWARVTGRLDAADSYWYPDSWARFLEPGRRIGCVAASDVWRSRPGHVRGAAAGHLLRRGPLGPAVERGLCVPPGYCLTECAGTLAVTAVALGG